MYKPRGITCVYQDQGHIQDGNGNASAKLWRGPSYDLDSLKHFSSKPSQAHKIVLSQTNQADPMEPFPVQIDCLLLPAALSTAFDTLLTAPRDALQVRGLPSQIPLQQAKHSSTSQVCQLVPPAWCGNLRLRHYQPCCGSLWFEYMHPPEQDVSPACPTMHALHGMGMMKSAQAMRRDH